MVIYKLGEDYFLMFFYIYFNMYILCKYNKGKKEGKKRGRVEKLEITFSNRHERREEQAYIQLHQEY